MGSLPRLSIAARFRRAVVAMTAFAAAEIGALAGVGLATERATLANG